MIQLKSCLKCHGDMYLDKDTYGAFRQCLQCGLMEDSLADGPWLAGAEGGARAALALAQSQLSAMRARGLTDSHPDIQAQQRQVASLREQARACAPTRTNPFIPPLRRCRGCGCRRRGAAGGGRQVPRRGRVRLPLGPDPRGASLASAGGRRGRAFMSDSLYSSAW